MNRFLKQLIVLLALVVSKNAMAQKYPFAEDIKRIVFLGNSITYGGSYVTDIETYFVERFPEHQLEFINVGLPSETVSGLSEPGHGGSAEKYPRPDLHERLQRVLDLTKPDLVFACYGMNDAIYLSFDETRFKAYKDGIFWLNDILVKNGVKRIIYITPPVYDRDRKRAQGDYNMLLGAYSDWLVKTGRQKKWEVIDLHTPMSKYLEDGIARNASFKLAKDGIHPGEEGHWVMAKTILSSFKQQVPDSLTTALENTTKNVELKKLVNQRQMIMKDSWLTTAGHKRPGMNKGLPLPEAQIKHKEIQLLIEALQNEKN